MKQLLFFFLFIGFSTFSQDFKEIDAKVLEYPRFSKVEDLANQIEKDFTSDSEKARAAFFWLTKNIRYNLREYYNPKQRKYSFSYTTEEEKNRKLQALKDKLVLDTFRNKTGVCEEYAQSFKKICDLLQIKSEVIVGNVRNDINEIGKIPHKTNHAWNAVYLNNRWLILDATWAAGYEFNGKWIREFNEYFYDIPSEKLFKTHFPEDNIWVLRFGRMKKENFYNQPIYSNTFLSLNSELIQPQKGIITVKKSDDIILKFKNLDPNLFLFYTTSSNKYAQKPILSINRNMTTLRIKNPKVNTNLVLFINKKDALHFKIRIQ